MKTNEAKEILKQYKENEHNNAHSDNFLLLAEAFKDENAIRKATLNKYWKDNGYNKPEEYDDAYHACNGYYYELCAYCKWLIYEFSNFTHRPYKARKFRGN